MRVGVFIFGLLGLLGFAAVAWRLLWATLALLYRGADTVVAGEIVGSRATRGDITGMQEAADVRAASGRTRRRAAAFALLWLVLLTVPPLTAASELLYSLYSPLWLLRTTRSPRWR